PHPGPTRSGSLVDPPRSRAEGHARGARRHRYAGDRTLLRRAWRLPQPQPRRSGSRVARSMTRPRDLQLLLTWLSPAFPVGAFAWSAGLETAITSGTVKDRATAQDWI